MNTHAPVYKDFWFKIIGCLAISETIDSIGRDEPFFHRFTLTYFYTDLLGGFVIALILWEIVRFFTRRLDRKYDWIEKPVQRLSLQVLLGIITPALLSFLFTFLFMKLAYDQDIFKTSWLNNEFYTVVLFIVLINLIYFTWWLYLKWKEQHRLRLTIAEPGTGVNPVTNALPAILEVSKAGKTILLPHNEIACAYLSDGYCYIKTFDGDGFVTTYTLDEVARVIGEIHFFRANRQILVSRRSCTGYKSIENGKIELDLHPPLKIPVIVSQKRASEFRKWVSSPLAQV